MPELGPFVVGLCRYCPTKVLGEGLYDQYRKIIDVGLTLPRRVSALSETVSEATKQPCPPQAILFWQSPADQWDAQLLPLIRTCLSSG